MIDNNLCQREAKRKQFKDMKKSNRFMGQAYRISFPPFLGLFCCFHRFIHFKGKLDTLIGIIYVIRHC